MRFYRFDPLTHIYEEPEPEFRDDKIRELVDMLPKKQRHMVSRVFFGGEHVKTAAAEIKVSAPTGRQLLENGLERMRRAMSEED